MKVVALVCSARQRGRCYSPAETLLDNLKTMGLKTEIINAYDYEITPCSRCDCKCFNAPKTCPIQDDVPEIWRKLKQADAVILAVPVYYGVPPALFQAIIERVRESWTGSRRSFETLTASGEENRCCSDSFGWRGRTRQKRCSSLFSSSDKGDSRNIPLRQIWLSQRCRRPEPKRTNSLIFKAVSYQINANDEDENRD